MPDREGAAALEAELKAAPIAVASRGSALLGGTLRTELTRDEVTRTLVEGFFPAVAGDARPTTRARGGLTQLGLPYASDPAVTRHLAWFLSRQAGALGTPAGARAPKLLHPTAVLFNGGVMKATPLRQRIVETLDSWLEADGAPRVRVLGGADLDLAVARGACAYALVRRGKGLRIRGGTARAYYVGIESAVPAVPGVEPPVSAMCVAPFGMEEGTEAALPAARARRRGGRARALPLLRLERAPRGSGRRRARALGRRRAGGAGAHRGDAARRGPPRGTSCPYACART